MKYIKHNLEFWANRPGPRAKKTSGVRPLPPKKYPNENRGKPVTVKPLDLPASPFTVKQACALNNLNAINGYYALVKMVRAGMVTREGKGTKAHPFFYSKA